MFGALSIIEEHCEIPIGMREMTECTFRHMWDWAFRDSIRWHTSAFSSIEVMILRVSVKPELLRWARDRANKSTDVLTQRFEKYAQWESSASREGIPIYALPSTTGFPQTATTWVRCGSGSSRQGVYSGSNTAISTAGSSTSWRCRISSGHRSGRQGCIRTGRSSRGDVPGELPLPRGALRTPGGDLGHRTVLQDSGCSQLRPKVSHDRCNRRLVLEAHPVSVEPLVGLDVGKGDQIRGDNFD